jgi:serine/threonine-protein kinase HipA
LLRATANPGARADDDNSSHLRISIAGAQEKTALLWQHGRWWLPTGATPTTHILKLPLGRVGNLQLDLSDSVDNEWLCAQILHAYGLPVARCHPLLFEDQRVLAVERFDRQWLPSGERLLRLPQEDLCQATGTPPHLKYEADGGPGIDTLLQLLGGSAQREHDREAFFKAQLIFWMLCAPDGHAKNFSLALHAGGSYSLTPLYDVLSAHPLLGEQPGRLSPHKVRLAMAVRANNAHWRVRDIQRRHWVALGTRHGIVDAQGRRADDIVHDVVERTAEVARTIDPGSAPLRSQRLFTKVKAGLLAAAATLARA